MVRLLLALSLASSIGFASADAIDSECRIQAKETAITTYQSCVKESRTQKIEEIRKEYQSKLQELKSYYDTELKKMSTAPKAMDEKAVPEVILKKKGKTSSTRSNGLPAKKVQGKSLPVRNMEPDIPKPEFTTSSEEGSDANEIVTTDENAI